MPATVKTCTQVGCDKPHKARGLCSTHYNKAYHRANAETLNARSRDWYQRNLDRARERNRSRDPEKVRAATRAWYQRHPFRGVASAANYKAKRLGVPGILTADGITARFAYFGGRCWVCRKPGADSIDHVKPLNIGGANLHSNIRPAHLGCNAARSWEGRLA
jgi:5-methylcytosine-specific restriction endonuclease McrA